MRALTCLNKEHHKEKKINKYWKSEKKPQTLKGFHSPAPSSVSHKDAYNHNHTAAQTVRTMPSFSRTLQSHCTAFQAAFLLCKAACETELLSDSHPQYNGFCLEELAAVTSLASTTGCIKPQPPPPAPSTLHAPIHPPIYHLFVGRRCVTRFIPLQVQGVEVEVTGLHKNTSGN